MKVMQMSGNGCDKSILSENDQAHLDRVLEVFSSHPENLSATDRMLVEAMKSATQQSGASSGAANSICSTTASRDSSAEERRKIII